MKPPALFRRYPRLADRIPWLPLGTFPTPVEPIALGGSGVWVKRDDLAGASYGGNKVRKLEFLLAYARRRGATRLITAGAAGSHHALATACYGRALGFRVTLVLFPQPLTPRVREILLLDQALGAELRFTPRMELVPLALRAARQAHRAEGCIVIPPGGSDPVGTLGYVSGALELAEQIEAGAMPCPEAVHVAAGTLGTAAGLALGSALAGLPLRIVATRVASRLVANHFVLRRLVRGTARLLQRAGLPVDAAGACGRVELRHDQIGPGYGWPTEAAGRAIDAARAAGLALDPTYTAKAAAGLLAEGVEPDGAGARLLWHTLSATEPDARPASTEELPPRFRRYLERQAGPAGGTGQAAVRP